MGMLEGEVVIVTGGARGIDLSHARLLADEGTSVVVDDPGGDRDGSGTDAHLATSDLGLDGQPL